jgi:hypothetical protein
MVVIWNLEFTNRGLAIYPTQWRKSGLDWIAFLPLTANKASIKALP